MSANQTIEIVREWMNVAGTDLDEDIAWTIGTGVSSLVSLDVWVVGRSPVLPPEVGLIGVHHGLVIRVARDSSLKSLSTMYGGEMRAVVQDTFGEVRASPGSRIRSARQIRRWTFTVDDWWINVQNGRPSARGGWEFAESGGWDDDALEARCRHLAQMAGPGKALVPAVA